MIRIFRSDGGGVFEQYMIEPDRIDPAASPLGGCWDYFASFYIISDAVADWSPLMDNLVSTLDRCPGRVFGGLSMLSVPGLSLRLLAGSAVDLASAQTDIWDTARRCLLGIPLPSLRKY